MYARLRRCKELSDTIIISTFAALGQSYEEHPLIEYITAEKSTKIIII